MSNFNRSIYALKAKTPFEKSLLKATYHGDSDPPKEKHVQVVIWALQGQNPQSPPESSLNLLAQRLINSHWATVLKSLIIIHRGIEQVGVGYAARIADLNIPLQNFNDPSERGNAHNKIIQDYYVYIRSVAANFSRRNSIMQVNPAERSRRLDNYETADLVKEVGYLLNQLQHLVKLGPSCQQAIKNYRLKVTQNAAYYILKDATPLYRATALAIDKMIDQFYQMERGLAEISVEHNKKFETCTRMLSQFFEIAQSLAYQGLSPPTFVQRPREVTMSMASYLTDNSRMEEVNTDLKMTRDELEQQRLMLEQFEKEHKKKQEESRMKMDEDMILWDDPQENKPKPKVTDAFQDFFDAQQPSPQQPQQTSPVQNEAQYATSPQQYQMINPMMTGMINPMMTGMINPMMTGMINPMMTGMINPMMTGVPTNVSVKSNLDPNSRAVGNAPLNVQGQHTNLPNNSPFGAQPNNPFAGSQSNNPFGGSSDPFANQHQSNNPFGGPSDPFGRQNRPNDAFGGQRSKDPFSDLL